MSGMIYPPTGHDPPLPLYGERFIHAGWPAEARCDECGASRDRGYVGPARGEYYTYPAPQGTELRFYCRGCFRDRLGLGDEELTGHSCVAECTDQEHVEHVSLENAYENMKPDERISRVESSWNYGSRGWQVVDVAAPGTRTGGGRILAIVLRPQRPLQW